MEMDEIRCIRLEAARFQETELDDKSLMWGASGGRAWGQNVLTGAAAERRDVVKLHNDMQCAPQKAGFSLLNHDVCPMSLEDAAFHKFNEMSDIGPWIDRQGNLQWDYVISAGFKGARSVRNGNLGGAARKAQLDESEGYALNDKASCAAKGTWIWAIWAAPRAKPSSSRARATHATTRASCASKGTWIWATRASPARRERGLHTQRQGQIVHPRVHGFG